MSDVESPWPERERTQVLLLGAGALFLLPGALRLVDLVEFGGTVVVGSTAVASALLIYGLLGWSGNWVGEDGREIGEDGREIREEDPEIEEDDPGSEEPAD